MKPYEYYRTAAAPYPNKDDFTRVFGYLNGQVIFNGNWEAYRAQKHPKNIVTERVVDEAGLRAAREAYSASLNAVEAEFKRDLYAYHGVENNPRRGQVFAIAWDDDHANGYEAVANRFDILVDLIK